MTRASALLLAPALLLLATEGWAQTQPAPAPASAPAPAPAPAPASAPASRCREVRCTRVPEPRGDDSPWLLLARAPLAPLRLLLRTGAELLLLVPRAEDEVQVSRRVTDVFFDDGRTFGVFPTAFVETGFEPNAGVRLVHHDLGGEREQLQMRAAFGGVRNQVYGALLRSGRRWSPLQLTVDLRARWREGHRFYGLGNDELLEPPPGLEPGSPSELAIASGYGKQELQARAGAALHAGRLRFALLQVWRRRELWHETGDVPAVADVYAGESVALFDQPLVDLYDELRVSWDGRKRGLRGWPRVLHSSGTAFTAWSGAQHELSAPHVSFGRVGFDLQPLIDLYRGDRVLRLRVRSAWAIGALDRIPFLDLPYLGGASLLRGYPGGRFRGRGTVLVSAEYRYPVQPNVCGYLFVDAGRAYLHLAEVSGSSLRGARLGFGGGLYAFTSAALLLRAQLASSIDGGLYFALRLDTADALGDTF